jgi:hypothetical protein
MQSLFLTLKIKKNNFVVFSFDSLGHDDDFIFEEFARIRLKGHEMDDTEA